MKTKNINCPLQLSGGHFCQSLLKRKKNDLPLKQINIALSYDWIEFTATMVGDELPSTPFLFSHVEAEHGTAYFKKLYKINSIIHGKEIEFGFLEVLPRPSFLDNKLVRFKLHNRFCYTPNLSDTIACFLREYNLQFKNYTRIDFAIDFQRVSHYGDNIQLLMQNFASGDLILKGKSMKLHKTVTKITGITWGSRSSGLSITMYNKTVELNKKGAKPWIYGLWKDAGFCENTETYRLEFSTKKPRYDVVSEDGETYGGYNDLNFLDNFNEHLTFLYNNFFQVAIRETGVRFSRCKKYSLLLLFFGSSNYRPQKICIKPQSNNIKKSVIKNIVLEAMFQQKEGKKVEASYSWELAMSFVSRYSLDKWWNKTFERLNIKSSYQTHFDIIHNDSIKKHFLKQGEISWN